MTTRLGSYSTLAAMALTLGLAGTLVGCQAPAAAPAADRAGGAPAPTNLTLITGENDPSEVQPFVDAVRDLTDGSVTIEVETNWREGEANYKSGIIRDVIDGKADMGVTGGRAFDAKDIGVTAFRGFLAPFLITSYDLQKRVLDGASAQATLASLEPIGLAGVGLYPGHCADRSASAGHSSARLTSPAPCSGRARAASRRRPWRRSAGPPRRSCPVTPPGSTEWKPMWT